MHAALDDVEAAPGRRRVQRPAPQQPQPAEHRVEGVAKLVRDHREELVLPPVRLPQRLAGDPVARRLLEGASQLLDLLHRGGGRRGRRQIRRSLQRLGERDDGRGDAVAEDVGEEGRDGQQHGSAGGQRKERAPERRLHDRRGGGDRDHPARLTRSRVGGVDVFVGESLALEKALGGAREALEPVSRQPPPDEIARVGHPGHDDAVAIGDGGDPGGRQRGLLQEPRERRGLERKIEDVAHVGAANDRNGDGHGRPASHGANDQVGHERPAPDRHRPHHLEALRGRQRELLAERPEGVEQLPPGRIRQHRPPAEAPGDAHRLLVEAAQVRRVVEVARGGERLHAGGDVMDLAVERQRQRAHGVAHPALGGLLLEPRVVEDQRRREQGHGDHRRDHQQENVIPKLHRASVPTTKMGGPEMAPHTPRRSSRPGEAVARLDLPTEY